MENLVTNRYLKNDNNNYNKQFLYNISKTCFLVTEDDFS